MSSNSNGSNERDSAALSSKSGEYWPGRINRILIAIGVIAFGLIIADRLISIYKTEDGSNQSLASATDMQNEQMTTSPEASDELPGAVVTGEKTPIERSDMLDLQTEFGSRVVFISLADPKYVITEDERRFEIGSAINEQTLLSNITDEQLILEKAGDLAAFDLSDLAEHLD